MANILLIDDSDVACRAMRGILSRGNYRCLTAANTAEAWTILHDAVKIDLLFTELRLPGENGIAFIQRLRASCFFKQLPVVVYTSVGDPAVVKKVLSLHVQDYLVKPYNDERIYAEIAKACVNPWRNLHFEEERSFCAQMGLKPEELRRLREELINQLDSAVEFFAGCAEGAGAEVNTRINALSDAAQTAGVWAAVDCLGEMQMAANARNWAALARQSEGLRFSSRLIYCHLHPDFIPDAFRATEFNPEKQEEARERDRWLKADVDKDGPVVPAAEVEKHLAALPACPAIDTSCAAFQMLADGQASSLGLIMDLVAKDPALAFQMLISAGHLHHAELAYTEDPRAAVSLLGETRLHGLAREIPRIEQRHMNIPPITWPNFWMFSSAVGKLAQFTAHYLEFYSLEANAMTAGLIHDIGKLLLLKLYPHGFAAMVGYSARHKVPLHEAERKFIGCTTRELGWHFGEKNALPPVFTSVIRWVESPGEATAHADLVAIVSLARHVCLHNHVGYCGDTPKDSCPPIEQTDAWRVLKDKTFPSFDLAKFEAQAHEFSIGLRQELGGKAK